MARDDQGSDALDRHGDLTSAYQSSYARHSGVNDGSQQSAAGVGLGDSSSDKSLDVGRQYTHAGQSSDTPSEEFAYFQPGNLVTKKTL